MTYKEIAEQVAELVKAKNYAYGDSFGRAGRLLNELYPIGIDPSQYNDLLTVVRIVDKLFRIANQKEAFDESPWTDILGYALLALKRDCDGKAKSI